MGWSIRELTERPGTWQLIDPHGGSAAHGTKAEMEALLGQRLSTPTSIATTPVIVGAPADFEPGDRIFVIFWHENYVTHSEDRGYWDIATGYYISGTARICYELTVRSLPLHWGGDWTAVEGSTLRYRSREFVFKTEEAATKAKEGKPKPTQQS